MKKFAMVLTPVTIGLLLSGVFGPTAAFLGACLSFVLYNHGEDMVQVGVREVKRLQAPLRVIVTEVKQHQLTGGVEVQGEVVLPEPEPEPLDLPFGFTPGMDFLLGTTDKGQAITMPELTSLGVGGMQGSGKTVTTLSLAAQSVVKYEGQVEFLIVDPHRDAKSPDTLTARLKPLKPFYLSQPGLPNPVKGGKELIQWLELVKTKALARLGGEDWDKYLVVVVDEFLALMEDPETAAQITRILETINNQARKVGVFAIVTGQNWKSTRVNGTEFRSSIASWMIHQMPATIANQLVPQEVANEALRLRVGQAILYSRGNQAIGNVPYVTPELAEQCVKPFLPKPKAKASAPAKAVVDVEYMPLDNALALEIFETYKAFLALKHTGDEGIHALALDVFGPGDPKGKEKVRQALAMGEELWSAGGE